MKHVNHGMSIDIWITFLIIDGSCSGCVLAMSVICLAAVFRVASVDPPARINKNDVDP